MKSKNWSFMTWHTRENAEVDASTSISPPFIYPVNTDWNICGYPIFDNGDGSSHLCPSSIWQQVKATFVQEPSLSTQFWTLWGRKPRDVIACRVSSSPTPWEAAPGLAWEPFSSPRYPFTTASLLFSNFFQDPGGVPRQDHEHLLRGAQPQGVRHCRGTLQRHPLSSSSKHPYLILTLVYLYLTAGWEHWRDICYWQRGPVWHLLQVDSQIFNIVQEKNGFTPSNDKVSLLKMAGCRNISTEFQQTAASYRLTVSKLFKGTDVQTRGRE